MLNIHISSYYTCSISCLAVWLLTFIAWVGGVWQTADGHYQRSTY